MNIKRYGVRIIKQGTPTRNVTRLILTMCYGKHRNKRVQLTQKLKMYI